MKAGNKKKKKVLVVGGAGYVGNALIDLLSADEYDIAVFDNLTYESRYLKETRFIYGDVRDANALRRNVAGIDTVVWLAAIVGDGACAINAAVTKAVNVTALRSLAAHFDGRIIFASTCSVYGANNDVLDESALVKPLSLYAETKVEGEQILLASPHARKHTILRFGTLFGIGGPHSRIRLDLVVNSWTAKAAVGEPLRVFGGGQWRPLLHVKDAAGAIAHAVSKNVRGLYTVNYRNFLMKDVAEEIQKTVPREARVEYLNVKFTDVRNYRVSPAKFRASGWRPRHTLQDGIREVYRLVAEGRIKNISDPVYSNELFLKGRII